MSHRKPDSIDLRLLEALQQDARASNRSLASRVHLSESACLARLRHLEQEGIIAGYELALSFEQLGAFETWVDVTLIDDEAQTLAAFERLIPKEKEIFAAYLIGEQMKFRLHVVTADFERWLAFSSRLLSHRTIVKGIARSVVYKRYRTKGCCIGQILSPQPNGQGGS